MVCGVPIIRGIGAAALSGRNADHVLLQVLTVTRHAAIYTTQGNDARHDGETVMISKDYEGEVTQNDIDRRIERARRIIAEMETGWIIPRDSHEKRRIVASFLGGTWRMRCFLFSPIADVSVPRPTWARIPCATEGETPCDPHRPIWPNRSPFAHIRTRRSRRDEATPGPPDLPSMTAKQPNLQTRHRRRLGRLRLC
jgi:hypothetical protein